MEEIEITAIMPAPFMAPPTTHDSLIGMAYRLFDGVKVMASVSPCPHVALAFVAAQVVECLLKAYIAKVDPNAPCLKNDPKTRHNLNALWRKAVECRLNIPESPPSWIEQLSILHNPPKFYIRYATGVHGLTLAPAEPMTSELAELLNIVATNIK